MSEWSSLAGRTLMVGLPGPDLDRETARRLHALGPGGVILFGRNLDSPASTAELLTELAGVLPGPGLFALDQEGGRVSRLAEWIGPTPTAATLTRKGEDEVFRFARRTAEALRGLGFNLDFAPVVDLCGARTQNGIGDRSFGCDTDTVVSMARRFLNGLQGAGVAGCLKHFPGLGHTSLDSHDAMPTVERDLQQLEREELVPYRELAPLSASIMVGHGHYPAWNPSLRIPASCSAVIVSGVLRQRLAYRGLVVSDDLEMGAVADMDRDGEAARLSLAAGCDLLLYCADLDRAEVARDALVRAATSDADLAQRLRDAAAAVEREAARWPAAPPDLVTWERARGELARFG